MLQTGCLSFQGGASETLLTKYLKPCCCCFPQTLHLLSTWKVTRAERSGAKGRWWSMWNCLIQRTTSHAAPLHCTPVRSCPLQMTCPYHRTPTPPAFALDLPRNLNWMLSQFSTCVFAFAFDVAPYCCKAASLFLHVTALALLAPALPLPLSPALLLCTFMFRCGVSWFLSR